MQAKAYKNSDSNYKVLDNDANLIHLKKLNIFVGANNSGKSRFLRQMLTANFEQFVFFEGHNDKLKQIYDELFPRYSNLYFMGGLKSLKESNLGDYAKKINEFISQIENQKQRSSGQGDIWNLDVALAIKNKMKALNIYNKYPDNISIDIKHIYIPILRGLRHLDKMSDLNNKNDVYKQRTEDDYKELNWKKMRFSLDYQYMEKLKKCY